MTCSQRSCVPKARTPSTCVTVWASQPSVSMATETTQRISAQLAVFAHGVHYFAEQCHVIEFLPHSKFISQLATTLHDLISETGNLICGHITEVVVQRFAGFQLFAVDKQRCLAG